jgi:hypothetical protein
MQLISFSCWIWCCFSSRECRARCLGLRSPFSILAFFSILGADLESSTAARCSARFFICRCSGLCLVSAASLSQLSQRATGFWLLQSDFRSRAASSSFRFCLSVLSACRRCLLLESQDFPVLTFLWSPSVRNSVRSCNSISHWPNFVS